MKHIVLFKLLLGFTMLSHAVLSQPINQDIPIKSMELRNYIVKPGMRESFADFMNAYIVPRQESLGGYMLNEFSLKDANDNFVWMRGFTDMAARSKFLKDFYYSDHWKLHRPKTNSLLVDSYDVHLLKPLLAKNQKLDTTQGVRVSQFRKEGITVADYYFTNDARNKFIDLFVTKYLPILEEAGIPAPMFWISETEENDYAPQHVFQDRTLLVTLTHFVDEVDYHAKIKKVKTLTAQAVRADMDKLLKTVNTQILYPIR